MLRHAVLAACLASGACYSETEVAYPYGYANLTYVAPGIEVITNFDEPVFFVDGVYWRWYSGYWYRSSYWDRGWVYSPYIPPGIRGIPRPWTYSHYRALPGHHVRPAPRPLVGRRR